MYSRVALIASVLILVTALSGCGTSSSQAYHDTGATAPTTVYSQQVPQQAQQSVQPGLPAQILDTQVSVSNSVPGSGTGTTVLSDGSFASEIGTGRGLAIVDFSATWCGPCQRLAPVVESVSMESASGAMKFGKIDIDECPQTSKQFNIYKIPCLIMFKDGREVDRMTGFHSKDELKNWIQKHGGYDVASTPGQLR